VLFIAAALLDAFAPEAPPSCGDADDAREAGLLTQADKVYRAVLAKEPDDDCAHKGLQKVAAQTCYRAKKLLDTGAKDEAKKAYVALLTSDPSRPSTCKKEELAALLEQPKGGNGAPKQPCPCLACPAKNPKDNKKPKGGGTTTVSGTPTPAPPTKKSKVPCPWPG